MLYVRRVEGNLCELVLSLHRDCARLEYGSSSWVSGTLACSAILLALALAFWLSLLSAQIHALDHSGGDI